MSGRVGLIGVGLLFVAAASALAQPQPGRRDLRRSVPAQERIGEAWALLGRGSDHAHDGRAPELFGRFVRALEELGSLAKTLPDGPERDRLAFERNHLALRGSYAPGLRLSRDEALELSDPHGLEGPRRDRIHAAFVRLLDPWSASLHRPGPDLWSELGRTFAYVAAVGYDGAADPAARAWAALLREHYGLLLAHLERRGQPVAHFAYTDTLRDRLARHVGLLEAGLAPGLRLLVPGSPGRGVVGALLDDRGRGSPRLPTTPRVVFGPEAGPLRARRGERLAVSASIQGLEGHAWTIEASLLRLVGPDGALIACSAAGSVALVHQQHRGDSFGTLEVDRRRISHVLREAPGAYRLEAAWLLEDGLVTGRATLLVE